MTTQLERAVKDWYEYQVGEGYPEAVEDLLQHGCQSGMVSDLIYYSDTVAFYKEHRREIDRLVRDLVEETGCTINQLFKGWDSSDPLANDTQNQNLLAWFGFEETARRLYEC